MASPILIAVMQSQKREASRKRQFSERDVGFSGLGGRPVACSAWSLDSFCSAQKLERERQETRSRVSRAASRERFRTASLSRADGEPPLPHSEPPPPNSEPPQPRRPAACRLERSDTQSTVDTLSAPPLEGELLATFAPGMFGAAVKAFPWPTRAKSGRAVRCRIDVAGGVLAVGDVDLPLSALVSVRQPRSAPRRTLALSFRDRRGLVLEVPEGQDFLAWLGALARHARATGDTP